MSKRMKRNDLTPTKAWIYGGLLVGAGVGVAYLVGQSKPLIKPGDRILLVGDSLSVGLAPPLRATAADEHYSVQHVGKVGTTMLYWVSASELTNALQVFKPTVVLVSLGTNDEAAKRFQPSLPTSDALKRAGANIPRLLQKLRASGATVLWVGPPGNTFQSPELRAAIKAQVGADKYFPSERYLLQKQPDGIHPTVKGYAQWTCLLWRWLLTGRAPAASLASCAP